MNEQLGLADMVSQTPSYTVQDVVQMILQGATPEQLIQMGVSETMINEAIRMLQSSQGGQEAVGLAGMLG